MCFILGNMKGLTYMQYKEYKAAVNTFFRIQAYDTAIAFQRQQGKLDVSYYVFRSTTEQTQYTQGRMLLIQNDSKNAARYVPVQKI